MIPPALRIAVESSSLTSIGYVADQNVLVIEFRNGSVYRYFNVPTEAHSALLRAESKGRHFNQFVRPCFAYERLSNGTAPGS